MPPLLGPEMRAGVAGIAHVRPRYLPSRGETIAAGTWEHDQRLTWRDFAWLREVVDGGFRHGGEVVAALALGARAVLVGRPVLWALKVGGTPRVAKMIELLGHELSATMARVGATAISEIDASRIRRVASLSAPAGS